MEEPVKAMLFASTDSEQEFSIDYEAQSRLDSRFDALEKASASKGKEVRREAKKHGIEYNELINDFVEPPNQANAALDILIDNPTRFLSVAGLHEIIAELDWLSHYLLKKHKSPTVFFSEKLGRAVWGPKYERRIREAVESIERLMTEVQSSLGCLDQYPQLAAYLMNREDELPNVQDPAGFAVEYRINFALLKRAFDRIKTLKHVEREGRDQDFVRATQEIMQVKRACKFRHIDEGADFDARTYNFNKDIAKSLAGKEPSHKSTKEQDKHKCRYLRVDEKEKAIYVYEKERRDTIHRARGKGQQRVVTAVVVAPALPLIGTAGLLANTLPHFIGPVSGYSSSLYDGAAKVAALCGGAYKLTEGWWMKRYHTTATVGNERLTTGIKPKPAAPQYAVEESAPQALSAASRIGNSNIGQHLVAGEGREHTDQVGVNAEATGSGATLEAVPERVVDSTLDQLGLSAGKEVGVASPQPVQQPRPVDEDLFSPINRLVAQAKLLAGHVAVMLGAEIHYIHEDRQDNLVFDDREEATREDRELAIKDLNHRISTMNAVFSGNRDGLVDHVRPMITALNSLIDANAVQRDRIVEKMDEIDESIRLRPAPRVGYQQVRPGNNGAGVN